MQFYAKMVEVLKKEVKYDEKLSGISF